MSTIIEKNVAKEMSVLILGTGGTPATGKTVNCYIRRASDDNYWTGSAWGSRTALPMSEVGTTGIYTYTLGSGAITAEDILIVEYAETTIPCYDIEEFIIKDIFTDVVSIKGAIIVGTGTAVSGGTASSFNTDLTEADDFWNDLQIMFIAGNNAGQVRRISDFVNTNGVITVSVAFDAAPGNDDFILIGRFAGAGSTLTEAGIADAVWDELKGGHTTGNSFGKVLQDTETNTQNIETDTQDIQGRLPTALTGSGNMKSSIEEKNDAVGLTTQEKSDVNAEADQALVDYDPPTKAELDTAEANIIAEIDANEVILDSIETKIDTILARIGLPPVTLWDSLKAEIDANEALIVTLTGNLATHDTDIKNILGTPIIDIITDINNRFNTVDADNLQNYNAIVQIQNNITTVFIVPERLVRPDTGTKDYIVVVLNYDSIGNMEDFDSDPTIRGDYVVGGGNYFGPTAMTHVGTGHYSYVLTVGPTDTLGAVQCRVDAVEGGNPKILIRVTEVTDYDTELQEIYDLALATYNKTDAGTPSPTIPAQLIAMEVNIITETDENQDIIETIRDDVIGKLIAPSMIAKNTGYSKIDNEGSALPLGSTEVPAIEGFEEFFQQPEGYLLLDEGTTEEELVQYTSITDGKFVLLSPTTFEHPDGSSITEITYIRLWHSLNRRDGDQLIQADSDPSLTIIDSMGNNVSTGSMTWYPASRMYYYDFLIRGTDQPKPLQVSVGSMVDSVTRVYRFDLSVIDRPTSQFELEQVIGGGVLPDTFVFDHDGWKDETNVLHEWTDDMAGPLKDETGKPATGILIRAFLKVDGEYLLVNNPPFQNYSNIFGHYRGSLEAGTYLFSFYKDNHKWAEVEREIG